MAVVSGRISLVVLLASALAAAVAPPVVEAHTGMTGILPSAGRYPWGVPQATGGLAFGVAMALALAVGLSWARFNWSRGRRMVVLAVAVLLLGVPGIAWGWSLAHPKGELPGLEQRLTPGEASMAQVYSGPYGGLTVDHHFGKGKHPHNPADILEAGGYIVDLKYTPDGKNIDAFVLETLQKRRFTFLVRPEIVAVNWEPWRFELYTGCTCFVALHFARQDIGNVVIVLFEVTDDYSD